MFQWALNQLDKRGRKLIIMDRDGLEPYLERYYLAWPDGDIRKQTGMRENIPFNTFLHRFIRSDDPVFHNHPWEWYYTVILKGGYWEHTPWGTKWRGPGSWKFQRGGQYKTIEGKDFKGYPPGYMLMNAQGKIVQAEPKTVQGEVLLHSDLHWVEIPKPGKTWTLFTRGKTIPDDWGFVPNVKTGEWIQHEEYLASQRKTA